jgi:protein arginine N-methyltransferase 1
VSLPVNEVDIIICQWMGYFLLFEDQVESVIFARDKYLSKNGKVFPDRAVLFVAAVEDEEYRDKKLQFWYKRNI